MLRAWTRGGVPVFSRFNVKPGFLGLWISQQMVYLCSAAAIIDITDVD